MKGISCQPNGGNAAKEPTLSEADDYQCLRSDGRQHDTGTIRPYRPCPCDFRDMFLALGQSKEIEEHYRTNWRVIRRWIEETGGDTLREARRKITGSTARPHLRSDARSYVMGQRRVK